jgi:nitrite reductase/ring-hydroxylating ferredoxin subunit
MKISVGTLDQLDGEGRIVACIEGRPILVLRAHDRLVAIHAACPHLGYSLKDAELVGPYVLECPTHRWRVDLRTGARPRNWWVLPANRSSRRRLQYLPLEVVDGQIFVESC